MKKFHLVVQDKDKRTTLEDLRTLGIVHVENPEVLKSEGISLLNDKAEKFDRVIQILHSYQDKGNAIEQKTMSNVDLLSDEILSSWTEINELNEAVSRRRALINSWMPWGDFNLEDIVDLQERGYFVSLVEMSKEQVGDIPEGVVAKQISSQGGVFRYVLISTGEIDSPGTVISLPYQGLAKMQEMQSLDQKRIDELEKDIRGNISYLDAFNNELNLIKDSLVFEEVAVGMHVDESLSILKGYCPASSEDDLVEKAKANNWGVIFSVPLENDNVPTLLKNPKWVDMIKPVFKMIDILPGYKEMDISLFFLLFFSLFFGILIGDAGYGIIFLLATWIAKNKSGNKVEARAVFHLMYVLSGATIIWGVLSGVFFGQQWLVERNVQALIPWLGDIQNVQMLCFFIGAVHLSIAHIWRAILKAPNLSFLGEVGWILVLWFMFFISKMLVLGISMPGYAKWLFVGGIVLILFFTKPNKNPLKAIGPGLGDFALNGINCFTDVVSYIRLFAVGLASVAVADAFNDMALGIGFSSVVSGFITAIILVLGHLFNIVLGAMSILVHGLRLNVLEFSGHLNMEWSGVGFNVFKNRAKV